MKAQRDDATKTRQRLLTAASEVFADKGYRNATIAEICARAEANIAAVNYHFRDKESLYREAWRQSLFESLQAHPADGGVSEDAPARERLRGQIRALLERITDKNNKEFSIVQKEMTNPTGLLKDVMKEAIQPMSFRVQAIIRELLGDKATQSLVRFCEISVISQCINPAVVRRRAGEDQEDADGPPGIDDIAAYAEHVMTFSLGGIGAVLDRAGSKSMDAAKRAEHRGCGKHG